MLQSHLNTADPSALIDPQEPWERLSKCISEQARQELDGAFRLALRAHAAQWRKSASGAPPVPYAVHPVRVACILACEWETRDRCALAAALLHDVLEDCPPARRSEFAAEIEQAAGAAVLEAVWSLTKPLLPAIVPAETRARRNAAYFKVVRTAPAWVRLVKCADRVDNLRDALRWGDREFWAKYSSETIGWHLFLGRETAPIAEVALFKALVDGERKLNGRVPVWVDGRMVDVAAAQSVPEHIARRYGILGIARRDGTLVVGSAIEIRVARLTEIRRAINANGAAFDTIEPLIISRGALQDGLAARLYGQAGGSAEAASVTQQ